MVMFCFLKRLFFFGFSVLALVFLTGCPMETPALSWASPKGAANKDIIASMGNVDLTLDEFKKTLRFSNAESALKSNPQLLMKAAQEELLKKYLHIQAKKAGIGKRAEVKFLMQRAQHQVMIDNYVASVTPPADDFPSEQLIQDNYKNNLAKFQLPAQVHLAQIFLEVKKETSEKDKESLRKKLADIAAEASKKGGDFAALAKKHSQHKASAANGGDMNWVTWPQLLPEFRKEMEGMKAGQIKGPIVTNQGLHLIRLLEFRPVSNKPYAQVRDSMVALLRNQRSKELQGVFLQKLLKETPIQLKNKTITDMLK